MPLYAYYCKDCQQPFDVRKSFAESSTAACCPHCGTDHTQRLISVPAVFSSSGGQTQAIAGTPSCAGCGMAATGCSSCRR